MGSRYEQVYVGQWLPYKWRNQPLRCCDCNLVHIMNFRTRKRRLEIQVFVDYRSTAASRRANGIKVITKKPKRPRKRKD